MFGDFPIQEKSPSPEEFLPYSCTELNKSLVDYARTNLNETEETREKALREIREFTKRELNIHFDVPDLFYLCFLRSRKFEVKRACTLFRRGLEFYESNRTLLDRVDSVDVVRRTIQSKVIGFLPHRDAKGRAIVFIQSGRWDPRTLKAEDLIYGALVSLHTAMDNPLNQVAGLVVIHYYKNITLQQVVNFSSWIIFALQALQRCCPFLIKEAHMVHMPAFVRASWKLVKPVLSDKFKKRLIFHKPGPPGKRWESLHRHIDPRVLPEELGGHLGPYSYEHWVGDIADVEKKYRRKCQMFLDRHKKD